MGDHAWARPTDVHPDVVAAAPVGFRVDHGWEGQPAANVQQRLRAGVVDGWDIEVRVYFATQHPDRRLLREAQAELDRLVLPSR